MNDGEEVRLAEGDKMPQQNPKRYEEAAEPSPEDEETSRVVEKLEEKERGS